MEGACVDTDLNKGGEQGAGVTGKWAIHHLEDRQGVVV